MTAVDISVSKRRAALVSFAASAALAAAKLAAGLLSGSLALVTDAGHALLDTFAAAMTLFAVHAADKPADAEHQYGHAKIEAVTALAETGLLLALSVGVLYEAAGRLLSGSVSHVRAGPVVFAVLVVSLCVDTSRWRALTHVARRTGSHALAADALHFASDALSSAVVMAGLLALRLGFRHGDDVAALAVALFILVAGLRLGRRTVDALIDAAPAGVAERLRLVVENVPGVLEVDALRLRPAGARVIGEVEVAVPRTIGIEAAEDLRAEVARAIAGAMPNANMTVSTTPRAAEGETLREKILLIAARRGLAIHHLTIQDLDDGKSASFDLELDARMPYGAAHDVASALEAEIRSEAGGVEVETHIEPLEVQELAGAEAEFARREDIAAELRRAAAEGGRIEDVHGVRVRLVDGGLIVNYHCRVAPALTVAAVHEAVDRLDHVMRGKFPGLVRIVGHAEPLRDQSSGDASDAAPFPPFPRA